MMIGLRVEYIVFLGGLKNNSMKKKYIVSKQGKQIETIS